MTLFIEDAQQYLVVSARLAMQADDGLVDQVEAVIVNGLSDHVIHLFLSNMVNLRVDGRAVHMDLIAARGTAGSQARSARECAFCASFTWSLITHMPMLLVVLTV